MDHALYQVHQTQLFVFGQQMSGGACILTHIITQVYGSYTVTTKTCRLSTLVIETDSYARFIWIPAGTQKMINALCLLTRRKIILFMGQASQASWPTRTSLFGLRILYLLPSDAGKTLLI